MKKNTPALIIAVIVAFPFTVFGPHFASAMVETTPLIDSTTGSLMAPLVSTAHADTTPEPTTPTTPADAASTTPLTSGAIKNGDPINTSAETILNTVVPPKADTKITTPSATSSATTTTPVGATTKPTTPKKTTTTSAESQSTPETTNVNQTFTRTTEGDSNVISPTNYYVPLDSLTPEATYALSFLAMILGIIGAVLILREPSESPVWMPGLKTQESLLDS